METYTPSNRLPWNFDRAKHLHRRASFGATWSELQRDKADGPGDSVTRLLNGTSRIEGQRADFEDMSIVIGDAAAASGDENRLKAWWLFRILFTPDPLQEKLALLWHNHFATSNLKVQDLLLMKGQNALFRQHAAAKFGKLLRKVLRDPAMLYWLDANSNRKESPNENLARELMELFTLGVGHFTEGEIKEAARALTGWTVLRGDVKFRPDRHDDGLKTILGKTDRFNAESFASALLEHKATSRRIAWRLCELLMGENVVDEVAIDQLAAGLQKRDLDIRWAVETILRSELFFSDANIASRISSPVEFTIGAIRSLELFDKPPSTLILAEWCSRLGQDLFRPPNVGGWAGGRSWLNSRTIVGRSNFAAALVAGDLRAPSFAPPLEKLLQKTGKNGFEKLLLGKPSGQVAIRKMGSLHAKVARLLSCPEAFVC